MQIIQLKWRGREGEREGGGRESGSRTEEATTRAALSITGGVSESQTSTLICWEEGAQSGLPALVDLRSDERQDETMMMMLMITTTTRRTADAAV